MANPIDNKTVGYYWDQSWKGLDVIERGVRVFRFSLIGLRAFGISNATTEMLIARSGLLRSGIFATLLIQDIGEAYRGNLPESSKALHRLRDGTQVVLDFTTSLDFFQEVQWLSMGCASRLCARILDASWLFYKAFSLSNDVQVWEGQTASEADEQQQTLKVVSTSTDCAYAVMEIFLESETPDLVRGAMGISAGLIGGYRSAWEFNKNRVKHSNSL